MSIWEIIEMILGLAKVVYDGKPVTRAVALEQLAKAVFDDYQANVGQPMDMSKLTPAKEI